MDNLIYYLEDLPCAANTQACAGTIGKQGIPGDIVSIIHYVYLGIQVVVPIILIIFGMIELGKAIAAQKEDEIKRAQSSFLKKLIIAVIVFLVFSIVKFVFNFAGGNGTLWDCISNILEGKCATTPTTKVG